MKNAKITPLRNFHVYSMYIKHLLQVLVEELKRLFDKYLTKIMDFKKANCKDLVPIQQLNGVSSLCKLFDALGTPENGVSWSLGLMSI